MGACRSSSSKLVTLSPAVCSRAWMQVSCVHEIGSRGVDKQQAVHGYKVLRTRVLHTRDTIAQIYDMNRPCTRILDQEPSARGRSFSRTPATDGHATEACYHSVRGWFDVRYFV